MGTLTMALAAVMLAGSAPEKVSGEAEQRLDLWGSWEGTLVSERVDGSGWHWTVMLEGDILAISAGCLPTPMRWVCIDEGNGRARGIIRDRVWHGVYRMTGSCFILCLSPGGEYPTSIFAKKGQTLLTLRRVRPPK